MRGLGAGRIGFGLENECEVNCVGRSLVLMFSDFDFLCRKEVTRSEIISAVGAAAVCEG
jgi:hypothetical protein